MKIDKAFKGSAGDKRHIEVFMIWLGDKLFKIENDYKATLEEFYKKNLENSGNVNYWEDISKKLYKNATIKKMSDYYRLLNYICKLITEYNKNPLKPNRNRIGTYSTQCDNNYKAIHNSINECKPYLQLLDSLKMIYENFRMYNMVIYSKLNGKEKDLLLNRVKFLTTFKGVNRYFVTVTANLSFDDKDCLEVKSQDEKIGEKVASQKPKNSTRGTQTRVPGNAQRGNTGFTKLPTKPVPPYPRPPAQPKPKPKPKPEAKKQGSQTQPVAPVQPTNPKQSGPPPVSSKKPGAPPSTSSQKDTQLKTPQAGEIHKNGPGGSGDGKGDSNSDPGVKSSGSSGGQDGGKVGSNGVAGDGSGGTDVGKKNINPVLGSHGGSGTQLGTTGGQRSSNSGKGDPVNVPGGGQGSPSSGASGGKGSQGITSSESGGSSGGAGGGKGDAGSGGNRGGSAQGDQGQLPGGTGSVQGGQAKGPGDPSRVNPVPAQSAHAPSGTGTTSSPQSMQQPPVPSQKPGPSLSPQQSASPPSATPQPNSLQPPTSPTSKPDPQLPSSPQPPTPQVPVPPESQPQPASSTPVPPQQPGSLLQSTDPQQINPLPAVPPEPPSQDGRSLQPPQTGGSSNPTEQKDSDNNKGNKNGANDNTGGSSSGGKDPGGGSSDPASNTSGGSFNLGSSLFGFLFNGVDKFNKASQFIEKNRQTFEDTKDKIRGAYNDTVENLKNVYNASSDYFNSVISNITSQLNQFDPPPKSGDSQTGSGSPTGGGNPSTPPTTSPHKQSPITSPIDPSKGPSSNSQQNLPPTPTLNHPSPSNPIQQKQSYSQPQPITHQNPHVPAQVNQHNAPKIGQLVKSLSSDIILKKPWNIFPTTWNGSGDCKPEIKLMNTTLVCCTSEQCSLTGILITLVLIPIILLIAYKCLPFGLSKKSEKKNMKRVINFHDGNRKTKIIISSNDKKKKLKPVINSVGGKKGPLLNIYKLMQADPIPFINLFFLLIFFVYKRKRDTIE
ncbi:PIR protein CIR protein [Plasmodium vinckei petteri]|uniref:PIR protein CIR protein n=1 Tax=Plasmodium vinckei petteri TaxID=138298 RepID=A0A6V7SCW9_PLAVN|nr:PIR protein CIR protein [Plasmodium vinckei petteri]